MIPVGEDAKKFEAMYELSGPDWAVNSLVLSPWNQPALGSATGPLDAW